MPCASTAGNIGRERLGISTLNTTISVGAAHGVEFGRLALPAKRHRPEASVGQRINDIVHTEPVRVVRGIDREESRGGPLPVLRQV